MQINFKFQGIERLMETYRVDQIEMYQKRIEKGTRFQFTYMENIKFFQEANIEQLVKVFLLQKLANHEMHIGLRGDEE